MADLTGVVTFKTAGYKVTGPIPPAVPANQESGGPAGTAGGYKLPPAVIFIGIGVVGWLLLRKVMED
jgi:hypothetical protein